MSVIDFPAFNRDVPRLGSFVVVALDPVASLNAVDDASVQRAAREVKTRKRLVMVDLSLECRPRVLHLRYHPVGSGLPRTIWQSIPIEPATAHPEGRPPVAVSQTLPVQEPYIYTTEAFEGEVSRIYMRTPSQIQCTDADLHRVSRRSFEDYSRLCAEQREANDAGGEHMEAWQDGGVWNPFEGYVQSLVEPMYHMWLHVDEGESYADPATLHDEIDELYAIEAEWRERQAAEMKVKGDRLQEWRDTIDARQCPSDDEAQSLSDLSLNGVEVAIGEDKLVDTRSQEPGISRSPGHRTFFEIAAFDETTCSQHQIDPVQTSQPAKDQSLETAPSAVASVTEGSSTLMSVENARTEVRWRKYGLSWLEGGIRVALKLSGLLSAFSLGGYW